LSFQADLPSELTYAPDGRIAFIDDSGRVVFLGPKTGCEQRTPVAGLPDAALLVFSPDVKQLATLEMQLLPGPNDRIVFRLWDLTSGKGHVLGDTLHEGGWLAAPMQFSADGRKLVAVCEDGTVRIWDTVTRKEERRYHIEQDGWDKRVHGGWLSLTLDKLVQTASYVPLPGLEDVQRSRQTPTPRPVAAAQERCGLIESVTFTKQGRVLGICTRTIGPPRQVNNHFLSGFSSSWPRIYVEEWLEVWEIEGRWKKVVTIADCHGGRVSPDGQWVVGTDCGGHGIRRWPLSPERPERAATSLPFVLAAAAGLGAAATVWWLTGRSQREAGPSGHRRGCVPADRTPGEPWGG
jgi:hypothetical protein